MDDLKNEIREYAISRGATLVGFTSVERLKEAPKGHKPEDILSDAKTVIVCANVIPKGVILYSSPTAYHNIMDILRYRIDFITYEISEFIEKLGFMAIPVTSDGPYFDWNPEKQHGSSSWIRKIRKKLIAYYTTVWKQSAIGIDCNKPEYETRSISDGRIMPS